MPRPVVSCLLPVVAGRERLMDQAIRDFLAQTWPAKELLLLYEGTTIAPRHHQLVAVAASGDRATRLHAGLRVAGGQLVCAWEDDVRHHSQRLEYQVGALGAPGTVGCCLADRLYLDPVRSRLRWLDWRYGPPSSCGGLVPETLLFWKRDVGEVRDAHELFHRVSSGGTIVAVEDRGYLTIKLRLVRAEGGDPRSFDRDVAHRALTEAQLLPHRDLLGRELRDFDLAPGSLEVWGRREVAYRLDL